MDQKQVLRILQKKVILKIFYFIFLNFITEIKNDLSAIKDLSEDSKKSNLLFTTKRIPEPAKSLSDLTETSGSQVFLKSASVPNLSQQDIRAISNKGFISNFDNQHFNNTENLLELKRISNHVNPNTECK